MILPAEAAAYLFHHQDPQFRLKFQIVLQCAPFLKGLRAASLITLEEKLCAGIPELFCSTGIFWRILAIRKGKAVVLFYRREELEEYVNRPEIRKILKNAGYRNRELEEMLELLALRMHIQDREPNGFPHEIGAFLGYPAKDVESFIQKNGREYLFVGYWKVYHDLSHAVRIFHAFDDAKEYAVNEFLAGKSLQEIMREEE